MQDNPDDEEIEYGREIEEHYDVTDSRTVNVNRRQNVKDVDIDSQEQLLPDLTESNDKLENVDNLTLLSELGLADTNLSFDSNLTEFGAFQNGLMDDFLPKSENNDVFDKLLSELNNEK